MLGSGVCTNLKILSIYNQNHMFELQDVARITPNKRHNPLEDLQYELCLSYIRHASEKLALRQSQLMMQSSHFINSLIHQQEKSLTQHSSTEASFENRRVGGEEVLSPRAAERRAFMRRSKRGYERPTLRSLEQALQEVKEVCSEASIAVIEAFMSEYRKIVEEINRNDFKEAFTRKKCQNCLARPPPNDQHSLELEERLKKVSGELRATVSKNQELVKQLTQKIMQLERVQAEQLPQNTLKAYLVDRENLAVTRLNEVKLVEREILIRLESVCQTVGCQRCKCVRAIKSQLVDFRIYLQRQAENIEKIYQRYKKSLLAIR